MMKTILGKEISRKVAGKWKGVFIMKKLVCVSLVLGLASIANAEPVMQFDLVPTPGQTGHGFSPEDPLSPSEWVDLDVVYNSANCLYSSGMLYISIEGNGEFCGDQDPFPIEDHWTVHVNFTTGAPIPGGNSDN